MPFTLERHLADGHLDRALREDARRGLTASPKELPPKWFYDGRGSALFEQITELPEYYPTSRERAVLAARADELAERTGADTVVELGSGSSTKTRLVLDALRRAGTLRRYVPVDVSDDALAEAGEVLEAAYPGLQVQALTADFEHHLDQLPAGGRRLVMFLGGTIGNLHEPARARFLTGIRAGLQPGDALLLGTDLVKDAGRLVAAYDDAAGVTAEFNRNVLHVLNRELDADFDPDGFAHVARWDTGHERIEMLLRSPREHVVTVRELGLQVPFGEGELMRTEISCKFRRERVQAELATAGMRMDRWWTDPDGDYGVTLAVGA